jgi:hypothetical protein
MRFLRRITRWCYSQAHSSDDGSTFVPWTLLLTFADNHGSGDRPGCEVSGAEQFSEKVDDCRTAE